MRATQCPWRPRSSSSALLPGAERRVGADAPLGDACDMQARERREVWDAGAGAGVGHLEEAPPAAAQRQRDDRVEQEPGQALAGSDHLAAVKEPRRVDVEQPHLVTQNTFRAARPAAAHDVEQDVLAPRAGDAEMAALGRAAAEAQAAPMRPAREVDVGVPAARVGRELVRVARANVARPPEVVPRRVRRRPGREAAEQLEQLVGVGVPVKVRARDRKPLGSLQLERPALRLRAVGQVDQRARSRAARTRTRPA